MSLQSTVSLGRVGRVLGGEVKLPSRQGSKENISRATTPEVKTPTQPADAPVNPPPVTCQEPDIVASAKASIQVELPQEAAQLETTRTADPEPVAPPRRRKNKAKAPTPPPSNSNDLGDVPSVSNASTSTSTALPIPVSNSAPSLSSSTSTPMVELNRLSIASLSKDFECSLDLKSATKGLYVTKPQVSLYPQITVHLFMTMHRFRMKNAQGLNGGIRTRRTKPQRKSQKQNRRWIK